MGVSSEGEIRGGEAPGGREIGQPLPHSLSVRGVPALAVNKNLILVLQRVKMFLQVLRPILSLEILLCDRGGVPVSDLVQFQEDVSSLPLELLPLEHG